MVLGQSLELQRLAGAPWLDEFVAWLSTDEEPNAQRRPLVELGRIRLALGEPVLARDALDDALRRGQRRGDAPAPSVPSLDSRLLGRAPTLSAPQPVLH
jgi:hypothetical protein